MRRPRAAANPGAREAAHLSSAGGGSTNDAGRAKAAAKVCSQTLAAALPLPTTGRIAQGFAPAFASGSFGRPSCARMNRSTSASISSPLTTHVFSVSVSPEAFNFAGARKTL